MKTERTFSCAFFPCSLIVCSIFVYSFLFGLYGVSSLVTSPVVSLARLSVSFSYHPVEHFVLDLGFFRVRDFKVLGNNWLVLFLRCPRLLRMLPSHLDLYACNPELFFGDLNRCCGYLPQCRLVFAQRSRSFASDEAKINYINGLLHVDMLSCVQASSSSVSQLSPV